MSRLISDILQAPEPHFSHLVREWENLSGRKGLDIHLATEINHSLRTVNDMLGLDPADTTDRELYYALAQRAAMDNQKLAQHIGITPIDSSVEMCKKTIKFVKNLSIAQPVWAIKASVIRQYLQIHPPKKLMKICGLRSIDSVLKRQNPGELLALSMLTEPADWTTKLHSSYKKLNVSDFDQEKADILTLSVRQRNTLKKAGYPMKELILPARETGTIVVVPPEKRFDYDVLLMATMLIETLRERYMYSTYFRSLSTLPKFGVKVADTLQKGIYASSEKILGTSWSVYHGLAARSQISQFPELGPGLEFEDPVVPTSSVLLSTKIPEFVFWRSHFTGKHVPGGPVSCHISDVVINAAGKVVYEDRTAGYLQAALWDEFRIRYLSEESLARKILK